MSVVAPKRFEEESKEKVSPSSLERGPRAVKEEEAHVRVVRVVRGSCFLSRLFVVIFTAKDFIVCFSVFALFAVHDSKR